MVMNSGGSDGPPTCSSKTRQTLGWPIFRARRSSWRNLSRARGLDACSTRSVLSATRVPSTTSSASYTSPIPPRAISRTIRKRFSSTSPGAATVGGGAHLVGQFLGALLESSALGGLVGTSRADALPASRASAQPHSSASCPTARASRECRWRDRTSIGRPRMRGATALAPRLAGALRLQVGRGEASAKLTPARCAGSLGTGEGLRLRFAE